jgi:hypothetical protein
MLEFVAKILLVALLSFIFLHGVASLLTGRVFCKGRWYEKATQPLAYWTLVGVYACGTPIVGLLALSAS